jgi:ornithine carbamoyltransferase
MKHLIAIEDLSKKEIQNIFRTTDKLLKKKKPLLKDKILAMIFEKPSTRTRVSFEVAIQQLGGHAIYLSKNDIQLSRGETVGDTAKVLSRYADVIMARVFEHQKLVELKKHSSVPVINGLSDLSHPCQALTDAYTILKKKGLKGRIAFFGDGRNNTFYSLIKVCEHFDMDIVVSCPKAYRPKFKGKFRIVENPEEAATDADVLYTDTFVSMGKEKEMKRREEELDKYQINSFLLKKANNPIVMHPLPAHRGVEITDGVMDGKNSIVFEQAENRLHVQKAILLELMKGK